MAAKTQAEWLAHIRKFVPSWQLAEGVKYNAALFDAIAGALSRIEQDALDHADATYVLRAISPVLDLHGAEVGKPRIAGETDTAYRMRIQRISNTSDKANIKAAVDALLIRGECQILEAEIDSIFCSRGSFLSRGARFMGFQNDFFMIVTPRQGHNPWCSGSRGDFLSRGAYAGELLPISQAYVNIIAAVDEMKAFGVMYEIVELAS